ncbi:MAG: DUF2785 domain-containing protein [Gammaproteobacteria bacterium]|jgi:hypothetical protein|nr:DUF2785 domain-containing protein [Gammaproteobacteria bacterium]MBT3859358.1 DUF2785 domain-containing protein [Gammaproteobacteria bacterium]MBT3986883.1 DUF2785 domain-containing protein [Gammaproteobacteria bacterium]MBT4583429.1 DUF2785 domain-containing protein [Gammaproteobacteria bacterium]MBT4658102.1 DUF2785 domain-containing protein [Gammaproteobacteria bacterium]
MTYRSNTSVYKLLLGLLSCSCLLWASAASSQSDQSSCLDTAAALDYWRPIHATADNENHATNQLARELIHCLGSADSELRDGISYDLLTYWLRSEKISTETSSFLLQTLSPNLEESYSDQTLLRSFSALILGELMRADNLNSFMSEQDRLELLRTSVIALDNESDFRGLVEDIGWVHLIAHLADVLWRFSLHSALDEEQSRLILTGIRSKAGPTAAGYGFNEGDRLARSVTILIRRQALPTEEFVAWLESFDAPTSMNAWPDAFSSIEGMTELNNSKQFIRALSDQLQGQDIDPAIQSKLEELIDLFNTLV